MTTIKNMSRGPRSMVPMIESPASGVRYGLKLSSIKSRASAVNRMVNETARTSRISMLVLRMRRPKRSRKYHAIPTSVATTMPTPSSDVQGFAWWIKFADSSCARSPRSMIPCAIIRSMGGLGPSPIKAVSESQLMIVSPA
jgi:hypothetical protein